MQVPIRILALLCALCYTTIAVAGADRDSLIEAWEAHMASLPGTEAFEATDDGSYRLKDADLPYDGEVRVIGALVRPFESAGLETGFSQFGMVEFELVDLPPGRLASQSYYYWVADRQTLHYSEQEQRWVNQQEYQSAISTHYETGRSFGPLSFMLNYGIWILLVALIVFVFRAVRRQTVKAGSLMDDSADINQQARENLERGEAMQQEVLQIARDSRDLHEETNRLLGEILLKLQR
jgi:hypothetical protein